MSDRISQALWKSLLQSETKGLQTKPDVGDKDLLRVLANFDKTDERKPEPRMKALNDLIKEIPKQVVALGKVKKQLGEKPFNKLKDKLYEMLAEAEALTKKAQAALDDASKGDDEDEDSAASALVNPKLLFKQLSVCRKDPDRTMKFAFVDAKDKQAAVLSMHPRVGARALFGKLQAATGVKTGAYGTAWVDGASLMLQLDKPLSGLVKKVRAPVKACGFRISKAVLWNEDGTVFEQDEADEDAPAPAQPVAGSQAAQDATSAPAGGESGAPPAPPSPLQTYEAKLAAIMPRVQAAAGQASADASKHERLLAFAAAKAQNQDYLAAVAALRQVELLLQKPTPATSDVPADPGPAFKARMLSLLPKIKDAQAAAYPGLDGAKLKASEAGVLAGKRDFDRANRLLDALEAQLVEAEGAHLQRRLEERVRVADAHRAFADYVGMRDTSSDAAALADSLSAAEARVEDWQRAADGRGDQEQGEKMDLLRRKLQLERTALTAVLDGLVALEALIAERDAQTDAARFAQLHAELNDALEDLAA